MTNLSLAPVVEAELHAEPSVDHVERDVDLPERVLRERAARYVLVGPDSLTLEEMDGVDTAIRSRMARAEASGLTPRDVLLSLLRPAFSNRGHCRCSSCRQTCAVCNATGVGG